MTHDDLAWMDSVKSELFSAIIGDVLDSMGRYHQILPQPIQPITSTMRVVGRAMPVLIHDVYGEQSRPFGRLTEALDSLQNGDVYVARGSRIDCAAWGEILTATARTRGGHGAVIDGFHRDTMGVIAQDWPVFSRGSYAQDAGVRSAVVDHHVPIEIGGVHIAPGDLIFGDFDGVVVVPASIEEEVIHRAKKKLAAESEVRAAILAGMSSTNAYERYGVL